MKTQARVKKTKRQNGSRPKLVILTSDKIRAVKRFKLAEHRHTGKLIHHRHTSHLALLVILFVIGLFLYASGCFVSAETISHGVSVGMIVPGPPPTVGAVITSPADGLKLIDEKTINVTGTCPIETFITIKNNGSLVGSTICTEAGVFSVKIQLVVGKNVLTALDYDNLNQAGPETATVTIEVEFSNATSTDEEEVPILPSNPSIIPNVDDNKNTNNGNVATSNCEIYQTGDLPVSSEPHVAIVCVPRTFGPNISQNLGLLAWGGTPPYAVSIDLGDNSDNILRSIPTAGYYKISFRYANPGTFKVDVKLTDSNNEIAIVQTAVQVNGVVDNTPNTPIDTIVDDITKYSWFDTPVPMYLLAVAITLGFWGGDLFDRRFGNAPKINHRTRRA